MNRSMKKNYIVPKLIFTTILSYLCFNHANAATFKTTAYGKFSDEKVWEPTYPGNMVKEGDSIIISSQIILNVPITIQGVLVIEKGAGLQGNKDILVTKSGSLSNKGNTVVKRLLNEGKINNELVLETMMEMENTGWVHNSSVTLSGSNLLNRGGVLDGKNGNYFSNNSVIASPNSIYGKNIKILQSTSFSNPINEIDESVYCNASMNVFAGEGNKVFVEITSSRLKELTSVSLEKSLDGKIFYKIDEQKAGDNTLVIQDNVANEDALWYRFSGYDEQGKKYAFPEALIKISNKNETLSMLDRIE